MNSTTINEDWVIDVKIRDFKKKNVKHFKIKSFKFD